MANKILIVIALLFSSLFLGSIEEKCLDCETESKDSIIWEKSTIYLDSLKKESIKLVVNKKLKVDSLGNVIAIKDKTIKNQKQQINNLKKEIDFVKKNTVELDTLKESEKKSWFSRAIDKIKS